MKKVRCKWVLGFMLGLCLLPGGMVRAKGAYQVTETDGELSVTYDDELVVDTYLSLKESSDSYKVVKPGTDNSEIYYFDSEGMGEPYSGTGFLKISYGGEKKSITVIVVNLRGTRSLEVKKAVMIMWILPESVLRTRQSVMLWNL